MTEPEDVVRAQQIQRQALREIAEEEFNAAVRAEKDRLKAQKRRWFPWKITLKIERL